MLRLGYVCGLEIDISLSPHYDCASPVAIEWVMFMLSEKRLKAIMLEPPCISFSPANHHEGTSRKHPKIRLWFE